VTAAWTAFLLLIAALLALDLGGLNRRPHAIGLREAAKWTALWVSIGVGFSVVVYFLYEYHLLGAHVTAHANGLAGEGFEAATIYLTAYLLEESLSVDNIFVIALVLERFTVPREHRHRVLFWGILGAIVLRGVMIVGGLWLVARFDWIFYIFGAYLGFSGFQLLRGKDEEPPDPESSAFVKLARRVIPVVSGDHGGKFVVRKDGKLYFTILFLALAVVEWTDVVFAMDSIPAVLAVANEPFIIFTSNIFAILGLRSLYFLLSDAMDRFEHLTYGLGVILIFIAAKMIFHGVWHLPHLWSLAFIVVCLVASITSSVIKNRRAAGRPPGTGQEPPSDTNVKTASPASREASTSTSNTAE
jgi:tellurite resistance protein TerC